MKSNENLSFKDTNKSEHIDKSQSISNKTSDNSNNKPLQQVNISDLLALHKKN